LGLANSKVQKMDSLGEEKIWICNMEFFFSGNPFFGLANAHPRKDSLKRNSLFELAKNELKKNHHHQHHHDFQEVFFLSCESIRKKKIF
jgi:hypothetical protein